VYETDGAFDGVEGFESGTSVLVSGDQQAVREGVVTALAAGEPAGDGLVVVATELTAGEAVDRLAEKEDVERSRLGVVAVDGGSESPGGWPSSRSPAATSRG
jgi:hypothetical protein